MLDKDMHLHYKREFLASEFIIQQIELVLETFMPFKLLLWSSCPFIIILEEEDKGKNQDG